MKTVEVWQWKRRTAGRWRKTRFKGTEEFLRSTNLETVRVENTMELRQVLKPGDPWPNTDLYPHGMLDFLKNVRPAKKQPKPLAQPRNTPTDQLTKGEHP